MIFEGWSLSTIRKHSLFKKKKIIPAPVLDLYTLLPGFRKLFSV